MLQKLKRRGHSDPKGGASKLSCHEERRFPVKGIIEARQWQLNGLSLDLRRVMDQLWDLRMETALQGAEPVITKVMLNQKADRIEENIKRVEGEIEKLKLILDKTITNKELLEYLQ